MTQTTQLDWTALGTALRQSTLDAHGELVPVVSAYQFLLDNPECFLGLDAEWPADMPSDPPAELIAAYSVEEEPSMEPSHDDEVLYCPDCERPNQFGEQCDSCRRDADAHFVEFSI